MVTSEQIIMMTSSNGNIFCVTGPLCGEFTGHRWIPGHRPVTRSFDVFFDLCLNKRLSKQWWGWWFETPSHPLWRHSNVMCLKEILSCWTHDRKSSLHYWWTGNPLATSCDHHKRLVIRSFGAPLHCRPDNLFNKQLSYLWFQTPWRSCDDNHHKLAIFTP